MDKVDEVLAGLREERTRLTAELVRVERVIAALEQATGVAPAEEPAAPAPEPPPVPVPAGFKPVTPQTVFAELGFYEAASIYLAAAGEPKTSREIALALLAGGYRTSAANFPSSARTMLKRHLSATEWGIFETDDGRRWYHRDPDSNETG